MFIAFTSFESDFGTVYLMRNCIVGVRKSISTGETQLLMASGGHVKVKETPEEVLEKVNPYR